MTPKESVLDAAEKAIEDDAEAVASILVYTKGEGIKHNNMVCGAMNNNAVMAVGAHLLLGVTRQVRLLAEMICDNVGVPRDDLIEHMMRLAAQREAGGDENLKTFGRIWRLEPKGDDDE